MDTSKQQSLPPGYRLKEFEIQRELGSGGFGITYEAWDRNLERKVVIKENLPTFAFRDPESSTVYPRSAHGEDAELFRWSLESFVREARTLAKFDHPNIARVLRVFEANGTAYFVMPYVEGHPFDGLIAKRQGIGRPFGQVEIERLLLRLLDVLDLLHASSVFHRDIKPANILFTTAGQPVLIDFGAARQRISERSLTVVESAGYTPMEQLQSRGNVGPWSDLYGLAATFYKAITFETPPKATDRVRRDPIRKLAADGELRGRYSAALLRALDRALAFDEEERPRSAGEMREAISAGVPGTPRTEILAPAPEPRLAPKQSAADRFGAGRGMEGSRAGETRSFGGIKFVWCPPGEFLMGSPETEEGHLDSSEKQHRVSLTRGFWLARTECTQRQWEVAMGNNSNPSRSKGADLPVEWVSWEDAVKYCEALNRGHPLPAGWQCTLPTEAQWEYGCRAGTSGSYAGDLDAMAWYSENSEDKTHPVGTKRANAWGLYDMHGNVLEWCRDWYGKDFYADGQRDPTGPASGSHRVNRGGSWAHSARVSHAACRSRDKPGRRYDVLGFRVAIFAGVPGTTGTEILAPAPEQRLAPKRSAAEILAPAPEPRLAPKRSAAVRFGAGRGMEGSRAGETRTLGGIEMVWCPAGEFLMGSPESEEGRSEYEGKQHRVSLTRGFWLARTECTQGQWETVMGSNPSHFKWDVPMWRSLLARALRGGPNDSEGTRLPVEKVSWEDVQEFLLVMNRRHPLPDMWRWDLPTEAQWEYACRAGTTTPFSFGCTLNGKEANCNGKNFPYGTSEEVPDLGKTAPVGSYPGNPWGLHDMHGNVWEWCRDWYGDYTDGRGIDPAGPARGDNRVIRGGSWYITPINCRSASRYGFSPGFRYNYLGFRPALVPSIR